jgi:hypothetical protein
MPPAAHRLALNANCGSDALERHAHRLQSDRFLVARLSPCVGRLAAPLERGWCDRIRCGGGHAGGQRRRLFSHVSAHPPDIGMVTANDGLNSVTQLAQQMPPIAHLNRIRCPLTDAVCVGAGPIAGNHLYPGMLTQPPSEAVSLPIRQQVDHRIAFQIDQNSSIPAAPAPGPVVNRQDARNGRLVSAAAGAFHQPQQRIGADRHGQPLGQTPTSLAAQRQSEMTLELAQALGALCEGPGSIGQRLGKGLSDAGRIETTKTAHLHAQHHRLTLARQIAERALITAVDAPGNDGTARARR